MSEAADRFDSHSPGLFEVAHCKLGTRVGAEDLEQAVFLREDQSNAQDIESDLATLDALTKRPGLGRLRKSRRRRGKCDDAALTEPIIETSATLSRAQTEVNERRPPAEALAILSGPGADRSRFGDVRWWLFSPSW